MPKRVLVVSYDFPPQGGSGTVRVAKFVRYLPEFGWQPVVVCSDAMWNYDASLLRQIPPQTEVQRVGWPRLLRAARLAPTLPAGGPGGAMAQRQDAGSLRSRTIRAVRGLLIPDPLVLWGQGAVARCTEVIQRNHIDAVLTTSPPHSIQMVGYRLKRRFPDLPWVADYRDPWSQSQKVVGHFRYRINYWLENACGRRADRILAETEGRRQQMLVKFPHLPESKVAVVTNGYDPEDLGELPHREQRENFVLSFVGSLYEPRCDTQFIPALCELIQEERLRKQIRVRFTGLVTEAIKRQLDPLVAQGVAVVQPMVPRDQALAEMAQADALLLLEADLPEFRLSHTNKLFEYLATGNPILAVAGEGEISRLIRENQAGIVAHPDDRRQIQAAILELLRRHESGDELRHSVPAESLARFERRNLTRRLAEILDDLTGLRS